MENLCEKRKKEKKILSHERMFHAIFGMSIAIGKYYKFVCPKIEAKQKKSPQIDFGQFYLINNQIYRTFDQKQNLKCSQTKH